MATQARNRTWAARAGGLSLIGLLALASSGQRAEAQAPAVPALEAVEAALPALPLPMPTGAEPWAAPAGRTLIDDFEGSPWPARDRWIQVLDLDGGTNGEFLWGPRSCRPASGARSLWAVGGGLDGAGLTCGSVYPDGVASSALLYLDLTAHVADTRLGLTFDIWSDAAPNEGLFINYVSFTPEGVVRERRTVYSATGRLRSWANGVRLDLVELHDRQDATWRLDLRGKVAYLELLFISLPNQPDGEGIFLDNLVLDAETTSPTTPTPGGNQTIGCSSGADCATLAVRAYVDGRCDGRHQPGLDTPLRGARVEVTAGALALGTALSKSGNGMFRVPPAAGVTARLVVPDGYAICPNASGAVVLTPKDFLPFGRKQVDFRVTRRR